MKRDIRLYNLIFPIWLLWIFPITWLVILPGNFIIDLLVVLITLFALKIEDKKNVLKKTILKTWILGLAADVIGSALLLAFVWIQEVIFSGSGLYYNIYHAIWFNPFENFIALIIVIVAIIVSGFCIYMFNLKIAFKKIDIDLKQKKKIALAIAVFTAPYTFLLPTEWFVY